jgi:hypothetical protein
MCEVYFFKCHIRPAAAAVSRHSRIEMMLSLKLARNASKSRRVQHVELVCFTILLLRNRIKFSPVPSSEHEGFGEFLTSVKMLKTGLNFMCS